jgi:ketopantoate reductase
MDKCHARIVWKCEVLYAVLVKSAWKSSMASSTGTLQCDCDPFTAKQRGDELTLSVFQELRGAQTKQQVRRPDL